MEQFYRFDRDYNFNYLKNYKDTIELKKDKIYNYDYTTENLVKDFLKKQDKEKKNK